MRLELVHPDGFLISYVRHSIRLDSGQMMVNLDRGLGYLCDQNAERPSSRGRGPLLVVREGGVEPPRPFGHTDLNRARLPIPPLARCPRRGCESIAAPTEGAKAVVRPSRIHVKHTRTLPA